MRKLKPWAHPEAEVDLTLDLEAVQEQLVQILVLTKRQAIRVEKLSQYLISSE